MQHSELGRAAELYLLEQGYPPKRARCGGVLAAVGTEYNYQGGKRIAQLAGCVERTFQRTRADLERDELLESFLLRTGQKLPSQRAAVHKPHNVRRVALLQWHARVRLGITTPPPRKHSAADVPIETLVASGRIDPEWARFIPAAYAASPRPSTPRRTDLDPRVVAECKRRDLAVDLSDECDRVTEELERGPPQRGPPVRD